MKKTTNPKRPCETHLLKLRLVNKEISRLTNAQHKAEMAVINGWGHNGYGPSVHQCLQELDVAREVKADLMERYSSNSELCVRKHYSGKKAV